MRNLTFISLILLFIASSCNSSNDDQDIIPETKSKNLISVNKEGKLYLKFSYTNTGVLSGYEQFLALGNTILTQQRVVIEYNGENAVKYNSYDSNNVLKGFQSFTYSGKLIVKREIFSVNSSGQSALTMSSNYVNDSNKPNNNITEVRNFDGNGNLTKRWNITYTNSLGSSISEIYDASGLKIAISNWDKDDKISWEKYLDPFKYQNNHNLIRKIEKSTSTGVETGYNAQYTYDELGYPISSKYTYTDGKIENYTFYWE